MVGMFTGIIQNTGKIISLTPRGDALTMKLFAPQFFLNSKAGDSVANNGVCLTIEECGPDEATFCLIHQTVQNTAFADRKSTRLNSSHVRISYAVFCLKKKKKKKNKNKKKKTRII